MTQDERGRIEAIAARMASLAATLRLYCSPSQRHISLEAVEKWARELKDAVQRKGD